MAHLKEVIDRITSVSSTQQITQAMKMVAVAKLHKTQQQLHQLQPYQDKLKAIFKTVLGNATEEDRKNSYTHIRKGNTTLAVVIAADRGLCGAFNKNVFKKVNAYIALEHKAFFAKIDLLVVGKKTAKFFAKKPFHLIKSYINFGHYLNFEKVNEATEFIIDAFQKKVYDRVVLVYHPFKSTMQQEVNVVSFLPVVSQNPYHLHQNQRVALSQDSIYEPTQSKIIETLIPELLNLQLYSALLESSAAEHSARMITMSKATDNANDLLKELQLTYNRTRQALITKAISEIVGGGEALAS